MRAMSTNEVNYADKQGTQQTGAETHRKHVTNIRPCPREHEYKTKNRKSSVNKNNRGLGLRRVLCNQKRDPSNEKVFYKLK